MLVALYICIWFLLLLIGEKKLYSVKTVSIPIDSVYHRCYQGAHLYSSFINFTKLKFVMTAFLLSNRSSILVFFTIVL